MKLSVMTITLGVVALVALIVAVILVIGAMLPKHHTVSRSARFPRPPAEVYATVRDFRGYPSWRKGVKNVEILPPANGRERFREDGSNGRITYEVMEDQKDRRLVTRIADEGLGYSGGWTYDFASDAGGTRVTITEDADVTNIFFRFMSRYVFGHATTITSYLNDLASRSGSGDTP